MDPSLTEPLMTMNDHPPGETSTEVGQPTNAAAEETSTSTMTSKAIAVKNEEEDEEDVGDADAEADEMASAMARRLATLPGKPHESEPFTIFRVAGPMRERNRHLYEPQMVSIGPFHRGSSPRLAAMEAHKWRYLRDLLARNPAAPLSAYARAARAMEPAARRRYAEPVAQLSETAFAEMLLLDGCFLVEFFLKGEEGADDALVDAAWVMQNVYNDLFLLENQLPFFIVERFYAVATGGTGRPITELLVKYLTVDMGASQNAAGASATNRAAPPPDDGEVHHLLHLYYHWFLPPVDQKEESSTMKDEDEAFEEWMAKPMDERVPWLLPSASEMKDAGVKLRPKKSPRSLVDVTFDPRSGALEIPAVESFTNHAIFANLLAYEQSRGRWELQRLVSYVLLMASVADAPRDVEVMQRAGVFVKAGGEETAAFYAQLGELCPPPEFVNNCYADLARSVKEYCGRSWNRHRAVLVHDYFSNPWTSMSAAAAVLLLVLTVVQTVYTVLPYYNPSSG